MPFKKIFIYLFLFVSITNCGFSPVYKGGSNLNLKIEVDNLSGDRETYNLINSNLNRYSYEDSDKIAKVDIETMEGIKKDILNDNQQTIFEDRLEIDLSYSLKDLGRFRVNFFKLRR